MGSTVHTTRFSVVSMWTMTKKKSWGWLQGSGPEQLEEEATRPNDGDATGGRGFSPIWDRSSLRRL